QIHQHGLAAADLAVEVEAFDDVRLALARAEQPAERGGFAREPMLGEALLELRELADDRFLRSVALDLSRSDARCILHRDGNGHARRGIGRGEWSRDQ